MRIRKSGSYRRRAFTLVELVVVLVILAVVATALIPALTGYIKRSRRVRYIHKADEARIAAQSEFTEFYGLYNADINGAFDSSVNTATNVNWL